MKLKLEALTHFPKDDPDCGGDYYDIELIRVEDGKKIGEWGDYYNGKGEEKLEGFVDGLRWALDHYVEMASRPEVEISYTNVADRD